MGKKSKKALEQPAAASAEVVEEERTDDPADDDALIPYHTKQASFALLYLLFFSFLMFTLPFGAFYGVRHALHAYFHIDGFENTAWSVLSAVVTVNIVIALYAIFGFREAKREENTVKEFASKKAKAN
jgi:hypothetical protein